MVQVHHRPTRIQRLFCWAFVSQLASVSAFPPLDTAQREACQVFITTPNLLKCPPGTVYVSPKDHHAQFDTIGKALDHLKGTAVATILIGTGQYQEQLVVDGFTSITLLGQVTTYGSSYAGNTVEITHNRPLQKSDGYNNWLTATLLVNGCSDFKSYNLKVSQTAQSGIALAAAVMLSRASFYANFIQGHQDTLFFGPGQTQGYLYGSVITGAVDFVYGWGTAVFKSSQLLISGQGTSATAWRGGESSHSGLYVFNSHFDKAPNPSDKIYDATVAVARPWNNLTRTMLFNCYLGTPIIPTVFIPWSPSDPRLSRNVFFSEYQSTGPGSSGQRKLVGADGNVDRDHLSHMLLDPRSAAPFSVSAIFNGDISWIDPKFGVSAVPPASGGGKRSSTPGALAAAPALAASLPPVSAASKRGPAPSGGKGTPLTKQDPKKTTHGHDSTKQKSKHHSKHVSGGHHHHHHSRHGRKHHH